MSPYRAQPSIATRTGSQNPHRTARRKRNSHRPVRAFCCSDREQAVGERTVLLGHFLTSPTEIARALREVRKAAMTQALHYDPARHAALLRLSRSGPCATRSRTAGRKAG